MCAREGMIGYFRYLGDPMKLRGCQAFHHVVEGTEPVQKAPVVWDIFGVDHEAAKHDPNHQHSNSKNICNICC